jgi:hypothetical protein
MNSFVEFWLQHTEWSNATFGADRGPIGALKHLEKEAREAQAKPTDHEEYADCMLLIVDASRRAGLTPESLMELCFKKLEKCKRRVWPKPNGDEPVEHVRGIHD